jgi:peptide chain release factor 1
LFDLARAAQRNAEAATRKTLVSTGDRSAKIRTYHFPQGRVTDHRIGWTSHALGAVLGGDLGPLLAALQAAEQAELLAHG